MSEQKPKKHKIIRTVKEDEMIKDPDGRTFQTKKYMIYNSTRKGWVCDCRDFMFETSRGIQGYQCKHIRRAKEL